MSASNHTTSQPDPGTRSAKRAAAKAGILCALERTVRGVPTRSGLLPWSGWHIVALLRYRERQRWALGVLLRTTDIALATVEPKSVVDHPGWFVRTSRTHLHATCSATGEQIAFAVNERPLHPDSLDPVAFAEWITSLVVGGGPDVAARRHEIQQFPDRFIPRVLAPAHLPEARLWRWAPSPQMFIHMFHVIAVLGLVVSEGSLSTYLLVPELDVLAPDVASEDFSAAEVAERWASHVADTELDRVHDGSTVEELLVEHQAWVQRHLAFPQPVAGAVLPLLGMHFAGAELVWSCDTLLDHGRRGVLDVLEFLFRRPRLPISHAVARLLQRIPVEVPYVAVAGLALAYLGQRQLHRPLALEKFLAFVQLVTTDDEKDSDGLRAYTHVALDWFQDHALPLIRRSLRSPHARVVSDIAAALVALDLPWCARELESAYRTEPANVAILRQALGLLSDSPVDVPRSAGNSPIATRAAWYRNHWPRDLPPNLGEEEHR